jgi:WD40-like Beta Propeller Repeat
MTDSGCDRTLIEKFLIIQHDVGMAEVSGRRPLRPFPALDPEPPRRLTRRSLRWPAVACLAAAAAAVAFLTWPSSSQPASGSARAPFADRDGLVVFEQQPSGMLGTAAPDGSHLVTLRQIGALQGTDLPVAAADGRHLVDLEGELVTMGPAGPTSVSDLTDGAGQDGTNQASSLGWADVSFADGGRYVVATACKLASLASQSWVADLIPAAGGKGRMLGTVTDAVGDPQSAAAIVSEPVSASAASSQGECYGRETAPDKAVELRGPGRVARTMVTAAELKGVLGWPSATPVQLLADPDPGGSRLALGVEVDTPAGQQAVVVISRSGRILAHMSVPAATDTMQWSPDGQRIAFCQASPRTPSSVTVWSVGQGVRTIVLPGRHDVWCSKLLWSPDGSQLIYAAEANDQGLTEADKLQHGWTVIDLRSGRVHDVTAPGQPAAWLPGTAGESR